MFDFLRSAGRRGPVLPARPWSEPFLTPEPRAQTPEEAKRVNASLLDARRPKHHTVGVRFLDAGKTGRLESSWTTTPIVADAMIMRDWRITLARARDAGENNDHAKKFLSMVEENVAGPRGVRFKSDPVDIAVDGIEKRDSLSADAIDRAYAEFSRKGNFDVTGQLSRRAFERLWARSKAKDGECLLVFVYGPDAGPYGFGVQMLDPLVLRPDHNEQMSNGNIIRHGIEMTPAGRPIAYHIREFETLWGGATTMNAASVRRVPAESVIHDFLTEMPGQKRGLSWMRTALARLRNIKGYEDAAVINARIGAAKMGFFRDENADTSDDDDLPMDAEPGVFENIGNKTFQSFDPQYPNGEFEIFMRACLRSVAAGLCVSYNNLASDLTAVNYSSIRQGALDERDVWMGMQEGVIENLCQRVFEKWLEYALLAGKIRLPSGRMLPPDKIEKFKRCLFNGRRWTWIDPLKEIAAAERAITLGIKSRQGVVRETSADDPYRTWDELAEEKTEMTARGIYTPPAGTAPSASPNGNGTTNNGGGTAKEGPPVGEDDAAD